MSDNIDLGSMVIDHRESINNADIICLVAYLDMGMQQLSRSPSATRNDVMAMDISIMEGLVSIIRQNFEAFSGKPELYMPNAAPKPKKLPEPPSINIVQNPGIQHQMYELSHMRTQLLFSEDAERMNSFHQVSAREVITPWVEKFESYNALLRENLEPTNSGRTFMPDANAQDAGVN